MLDIYTYSLWTGLPRRPIQHSLSNGDQLNAQLRHFRKRQSEFSEKHNDIMAIYPSKWSFSPGLYLVELIPIISMGFLYDQVIHWPRQVRLPNSCSKCMTHSGQKQLPRHVMEAFLWEISLNCGWCRSISQTSLLPVNETLYWKFSSSISRQGVSQHECTERVAVIK